MAKTIRVHVDTLKYTRQGLRTRAEIPLHVSHHNKIVIVRAERVVPFAAGYAGFPEASAFPGPPVLALMRTLGDAAGEGVAYQVFGHTDAAKSEAEDKTLTDLRARATRAVLIGDIDEALAVRESAPWDDRCVQVMLRALRCDPGKIDGAMKDASKQAVLRFQERYVDNVFHARSSLPHERRFPTLRTDGELDADTHQALVEAYVVTFSPGVKSEDLHPAAPIAGCGAFNRVVPSPSPLNRRVTLIGYPSQPDHPESAPCTVGDAAPCAVVYDELQRCSWYTEHVRDRDPKFSQHRHFSLAWLLMPDGRYLLSALTTVPDGEDVTFEVFAAPEPITGEAAGALGEMLSDPVTGTPERGVVQVVWTPPEGFAPSAEGRLLREDAERGPVPVFRVSHADADSGQAAMQCAPFPRRATAATVPAGVFGFDSAFPRPGIWSSLQGFPELLADGVEGVVAFGHTDAVGSESYNKHLADRRARAVAALVRSDLAAVAEIAQEEGWGTDAYQAMLRAVGCDPGPPDGDAGEMTDAAIRAFQRGYPRGLFIDPDFPRDGPELEESGSLDEATKDAILEAYVHHLGLGLKNLPSVGQAFAGCGEFNRLSDEAPENRRVTLAVFQELPDERLPCTEGDETQCAVDRSDGARRCSFYREQVLEPEEPVAVPEFFDDHWMPTPSLRASMSVLTSLPDDTPVTFTVYRSGPVKPPMTLSSFYDDVVPDGLEEIVKIEGRVLHGIAFAVWEGDDEFHPFDEATWVHAPSVAPLREGFDERCASLDFLLEQMDLLRDGTRYRPPVFLIEGGGAWLLSRPPGRRIRGLEVRGVQEQEGRMAVRPDGRVFTLEASDSEERHDDTVTQISLGPVRSIREVER